MTQTAPGSVAPRTPPGLTTALAEWVADGSRDIEERIRVRARRMLLDVLGVAVRGAGTPVAGTARSVLGRVMPGTAGIVGTGERAAPPAAAFANGVAAHALELDDGYTRGSVHPSAVVFPAVLAVAEELDLSVGELVDAFAVGAEVTCRIAEAGHPETYWRGFHNTPLAGAIGAAAGAARALGLDAAATASAIGIACSHSGGLFQFVEDGADVKRLHPGMAARNGWESAFLAAAGVTGPARALEGRRGYFHAFAGRSDEASVDVVEGLGTSWRILDVYVKPHACCRALHASVDGLLRLRDEEGVRWPDVRRVTVRTYRKAAEYCGTRVASLLDAQMSLPVAAVVALRSGRVGLDELAEAAAGGVSAADLARVTVEHAAEYDALYPPLRPTLVRVETADGMLERYLDRPYGEPGNDMSAEDLHRKFLSLAAPVLGEATAEALARALDDSTLPVRDLVALTSGRP
jgi:2-methylcitrate dehydratase PrpD